WSNIISLSWSWRSDGQRTLVPGKRSELAHRRTRRGRFWVCDGSMTYVPASWESLGERGELLVVPPSRRVALQASNHLPPEGTTSRSRSTSWPEARIS